MKKSHVIRKPAPATLQSTHPTHVHAERDARTSATSATRGTVPLDGRVVLSWESKSKMYSDPMQHCTDPCMPLRAHVGTREFLFALGPHPSAAPYSIHHAYCLSTRKSEHEKMQSVGRMDGGRVHEVQGNLSSKMSNPHPSIHPHGQLASDPIDHCSDRSRGQLESTHQSAGSIGQSYCTQQGN